MGKGGRKGGNKKKHTRGGDKYVSGAQAVMARNRAAEQAEQEDPEAENSDSSAEEQLKPAVFQKEKKSSGVSHLMGSMSLNDGKPHHVDKDGIQMTRRQKEELAKEKKARLYREAHKRGETDEAKNDLGRLQAVKARRDAAAKAKQEADDQAKAAETAKYGVNKEYKEALGSDAARLRGARSAATKAKKTTGYAEERGAGNDKDMYVAYSNVKSTVDMGDCPTAAAKAIEEDFM